MYIECLIIIVTTLACRLSESKSYYAICVVMKIIGFVYPRL